MAAHNAAQSAACISIHCSLTLQGVASIKGVSVEGESHSAHDKPISVLIIYTLSLYLFIV